MKGLGVTLAAAGVVALAYLERDKIFGWLGPKPPIRDFSRAHRSRTPAAPTPAPVRRGSANEEAIQDAADMAKGTVRDVESLTSRFGVKLPGLPFP